MLDLTNKQFALIGIFVIATLQLIAYGIGFDGQFTILCTGILTYLFGIVTGKELEKAKQKTNSEN